MKIIVNGLVAEYLDEGEGETLLFLPGWMNTIQNFDALASRLVSSYRIVRLDLPGFGGGTEAPPADWHVADYVAFVQSFTEKIGLSSYVLVGHSFGGRVALRGIADASLRPSRLILISSAGVAKHRTLRNRTLTMFAKVGKLITAIPPLSFWRKRIREALYKKLKSDYLAAGAMSQTYLNSIREDLTEAARKVSVPALLIWGSEDVMTPLKDGELFTERIAGSRLEVFFDVGHSPHCDKPDEVAKLIAEFV